MELTLISDTHGQHHKLTHRLTGGDMIIHAGDISQIGGVNEITNFLDWFSKLPYTHRIFIAGNHDFFFENGEMNMSVDKMINQYPEVTYLQDSYVDIDGIRIYGTPWTPRFYNWAFMKSRSIIKDKWEDIPYGVDLLIVHGPPADYGDQCSNGDRVGCVELLKRIETIKPKLCVYGHIHEGYGMYSNDDTTFINCSVLDEHYWMVNEPVVIKYEDFL